MLCKSRSLFKVVQSTSKAIFARFKSTTDYIHTNEDYSTLTNEEAERVYQSLNRIMDQKPKHHYTTHDPLPPEVVEDEPSIAYLAEELRPDYSKYEGNRFLSVGLCGAPNAGKSTLVNALMGEKVSAVSSKPNTTRCSMLGSRTIDKVTLDFYDTPGIMQAETALKPERELAKIAEETMNNLDAIITVIDASVPLTLIHRQVLEKASEISFNNDSLLYIALNKVDLVSPKEQLLQYSSAISEVIWKKKIDMLRKTPDHTIQQLQWENEELYMISALQKDGIDDLLNELCLKAKPSTERKEIKIEPFIFPKERASEIVREKVFKYYNGVVPFDLKMHVLDWNEGDDKWTLQEEIHVSKKENAMSLDRIKRKLEKTSALELTSMVHKKVVVSVTIVTDSS